MGEVAKFGTDITRGADALEKIAAALTYDTSKMEWGKLAELVHKGEGPGLGDKITVTKGAGTVVFDVVHKATLEDASGNSLPRIILLRHDAPDGVQFDSQEAIYYASSALAAGTYNFKMTDSDTNTKKYTGKSYYFTTTKTIPAGGQIKFSGNTSDIIWGSDAPTAHTIETYSSNSATTVLESGLELREGTSGTYLGDLNAVGDASHPLMNSFHRGTGSNNYKESAIRQWLNSDASKGNVWKPTNPWDRNPTWVSSLDGFLNGLDTDFVNILAMVPRVYVTNTKFETSSFKEGSSYKLSDKIFLPSKTEIFGDNENSIADGIGTQFQLFKGSANIDRIKYDKIGGTSPQYWWLSTPNATSGLIVRRVDADGSLHSDNAPHSLRAVPACII